MYIPYIGITDFISFQQVKAMLEVFKAHQQKGSKRQLHVGVMMSYKTLHGIPTKWQNAFPPNGAIARIFSSDKVYNCLHYADYDNSPDLPRSLSLAIEKGGIGIRAIQLDMPWPNAELVYDGVDRSRKRLEVILQIGRQALNAIQNDPERLVRKLHDYAGGVIHRVLLDKSGGEGRGMDAAGLLPFARAIRENLPELGLVVAGGLGPEDEDIGLVKPIIEEFPDVSIDAQGKLRPSGNALDPVDWHMAGRYLFKALQLLK